LKQKHELEKYKEDTYKKNISENEKSKKIEVFREKQKKELDDKRIKLFGEIEGLKRENDNQQEPDEEESDDDSENIKEVEELDEVNELNKQLVQ
jgi:hypothetical protein